MSARPPVRIDVLSDVVCPWCFIGKRRLERAIGVLYLPQTELHSHYFHARIAEQFDTVLHYDRTRAVEPLERSVVWDVGEVPETFPTGV